MRILTLLFFLITLSASAEPDWGQYKMTGHAFVNDNIPIINDTLVFKVADKELIVITDKEGKYSVTITWTTWDFDAGPSTNNGNPINVEQINEEINPPVIIKYKNKTTTVKNFWKDERQKPNKERGQTRNIDIKI